MINSVMDINDYRIDGRPLNKGPTTTMAKRIQEE